MITKIERAKTGRSTCQGCDNKIEKGTWRGVENSFFYAVQHLTKRYYCADCTKKKVENQKIKLDGILEELCID